MASDSKNLWLFIRRNYKMKKCLLYSTAVFISYVILPATVMACFIINKDVHNESGEDAHGFAVVLSGMRAVEDHFDGWHDAEHFHDFEWETLPNSTILRWSAPREPGEFPACPEGPITDSVHVGWQLNSPARVILSCWTDGNLQCIEPVPQSSHWLWWKDVSNGVVALTFFNALEDSIQVTVSDVYYAILPQCIPLDNLNARNSELEAQLHLLDAGPYTIAPGKAQVLYIPEPVNPGQTVVYRFQGEGFVDFGEKVMQERSIPTFTQWGLIALLIILAGIATWVVLKRRKVVTA